MAGVSWNPSAIDRFLDRFDGPVEVADGVYFDATFSAITAFETEAGLVLVDTGLPQAAPTLAGRLRAVTDAPTVGHRPRR